GRRALVLGLTGREVEDVEEELVSAGPRASGSIQAVVPRIVPRDGGDVPPIALHVVPPGGTGSCALSSGAGERGSLVGAVVRVGGVAVADSEVEDARRTPVVAQRGSQPPEEHREPEIDVVEDRVPGRAWSVDESNVGDRGGESDVVGDGGRRRVR